MQLHIGPPLFFHQCRQLFCTSFVIHFHRCVRSSVADNIPFITSKTTSFGCFPPLVYFNVFRWSDAHVAGTPNYSTPVNWRSQISTQVKYVRVLSGKISSPLAKRPYSTLASLPYSSSHLCRLRFPQNLVDSM
jgi:hypothetical protein